jgi:potassium efflux system protein
MKKNLRPSAFASLLLIIVSLCQPSSGLGQTNNALTEKLVKHRLQALGADDNTATREAYESVSRWLQQANAHDQDAVSYEQQAANAPIRKAEIQLRMDELESANSHVSTRFDGLALDQLEAKLAAQRAALAEAINERDAVDRRMQAREVNAEQAHRRLQEISERLPQLGETTVTLNRQASPSLLEATQWNTLGEQLALEAERRALNAKLASQPARFSVMPLQRAELAMQMEQNAATIALLETQLSARENSGESITDIGIPPDQPAYPVAEALAISSSHLRQQRTDLTVQRRAIAAQRDQVQRQSRILSDRFATARRVVDFAGDSDVLGNVLLVHWREIENYQIDNPTEGLAQAIGNSVISRIAHEEALAALASSSAHINDKLAQAKIEPDQVTQADRAKLVELARKNREQLNILIADESSFIDAAAQLKSDYQRLTELTLEYRTFLDGLILWIPSHPPLQTIDFAGIPETVASLLHSRPDIDLAQVEPAALLALLAALLLVASRRRLRQAQRDLSEKIVRPREDAISYTISALLLTLLQALTLPLVLIGVSGLFASGSSLLSQAIAEALLSLVTLAYVLSSLHYLCAKYGVGRNHFGWHDATCDRLRREADLFQRVGLPMLGITAVVLLMEIDNSEAALGRLLYLATLLLLMGHIGWLMKRSAIHHRSNQTLITRLRLRAGALLACAMATIAVAMGHLYSVDLLFNSAVETSALCLALLLIYGLLSRWLQIARRRVRMAQLLAYRNAETDTEQALNDDSRTGLIELGDTSAQLLMAGTLTTGFFALIYLWSPLLPVLTALNRVTLWTTTAMVDGESIMLPITLQTVTIVIFLAIATFYCAKKLPALIELLLRQHTSISASARYTVITLVNYIIIGTGLITALGALGLKWSQLQWLVAALGVGIGFGLQEIVANFISGLIILFERPIRVGDVVTVGGQEGTVSRIRIRATTIRDWDGKELLVPNKDFITSQLLNWTLSDQVTRIVINVGIAYGSDVEQALKLLEELIVKHQDVIDDPPSRVLFTELGDSSLILVARCFIRSVDDRMKVVSELHRAIYARFNEAGLVFAFPQLDVHLDAMAPISNTREQAGPLATPTAHVPALSPSPPRSR